jgi:hypothetical protein
LDGSSVRLLSEFIASQLAKVPTRGDLAKTALGIIFCTAVFTNGDKALEQSATRADEARGRRRSRSGELAARPLSTGQISKA